MTSITPTACACAARGIQGHYADCPNALSRRPTTEAGKRALLLVSSPGAAPMEGWPRAIVEIERSAAGDERMRLAKRLETYFSVRPETDAQTIASDVLFIVALENVA